MSRSSWNQEVLFWNIMTLTESSQVRNTSADPKSLYSDNFDETDYFWNISIKKSIRRDPDELIAALLVLSAVEPFWYELFLDFCGQQCYSFAYKGKWRKLHKLVKVQRFPLLLLKVQELYTPEAFFGNIYSKMKKFSKDPSVRFLKQRRSESRPPQRKRGYNDKGSMKLPHEIHAAWRHSGPNKKRPDYRRFYKRNVAILNYLYD